MIWTGVVAALLLLSPGEAALALSLGGAIALASRRLDRARTAMGVDKQRRSAGVRSSR